MPTDQRGSDGLTSRAFRQAESKVYASYGLTTRARELPVVVDSMALRATEIRSAAAPDACAAEDKRGDPTRVVLLLHGISLCSAHWAPLIAALPPHRRYLALDMPGHGGSDAIDHRGMDLRRRYTGLLSKFLDELGVGTVDVVGHSYGGMLGLWLALDTPDRVSSVAVIGTPAVAFGARPDLTLRLLSMPAAGPLTLSMPSPEAIYRRVLAISLGRAAISAAPPSLLRATYLATRRSGAAYTISTYLREQFRGARSNPPRYTLTHSELAQIRRPVLVIWGQDDDHYQPPGEGKDRTALMPHGRFEQVPGGHEPWLDNPTVCARLLTDFLTDTAATPQDPTHSPTT